jgi:hypothetical protein
VIQPKPGPRTCFRPNLVDEVLNSMDFLFSRVVAGTMDRVAFDGGQAGASLRGVIFRAM